MGLSRTSLLAVLSCAVMSVQAANFNSKSFSSPENFDGLGKTKKSLETGYKSYGVQTVQKKDGHPVKSGESSVRFEVRDGDCGKNRGSGSWDDCKEKNGGNERHELSLGSNGLDKGAYEYGWDIYIPADVNWPRLVSIFLGQWHEKITGIYSGGDPLIYFYIQDKDLVFQRRHNCGSPLNLPLKMVKDMADKWTRIKVMVDWTDEPSGYFDVYVDDSLAISYDGPTLRKQAPGGAYFKFGIYRTQVGREKKLLGDTVVYYDNVYRRKQERTPLNIVSNTTRLVDCNKAVSADNLPKNANLICTNASIEWRRKKLNGKWVKKANELGLNQNSCKALLRK